MKSLKDFFYNKNDIFIALVLVAVAAAIILWRMDVIMDYPQTLAEESGIETEETGDAKDQGNKSNASEDADTPNGQTSASLWNNGTLSKEITVTIQTGSATAAVQSLIDAGLFESYDEFSQVCKAAGYTPENIKATTFTFDAGSTQTDIAKEITQ